MPKYEIPMTFAVTIGCHGMKNFIRLSAAYLRKIFGDEVAICLYDSPSDANDAIKKIAEDYWCAYFCERENRGHFCGCQQTSVSAVAFAKHHGADIAVKLNQRLILLAPEIPQLIHSVFKDPQVDLALPGQCSAESILRERSRFHSRFKLMPDCIFIRAKAFNPECRGVITVRNGMTGQLTTPSHCPLRPPPPNW